MSISISREHVFIPQQLGNLGLSYNGKNFLVTEENGNRREVQRAFISKELRGLSSEQVNRIGGVGYLSLKTLKEVQSGQKDYSIEFNPRIQGGGPILGFITAATMITAGAIMVCFPPTSAAGVGLLITGPKVGAALALTPTP